MVVENVRMISHELQGLIIEPNSFIYGIEARCIFAGFLKVGQGIFDLTSLLEMIGYYTGYFFSSFTTMIN